MGAFGRARGAAALLLLLVLLGEKREFGVHLLLRSLRL